jgi:hypothetical protein
MAAHLRFTQSYQRDELNRLKSAVEQPNAGTSWQQYFLYDRFRHRTKDTSAGKTTPGLAPENPAIDPANNCVTGGSHIFDNAGNMTVDGQRAVLGYDAENHMISFNTGGSLGLSTYRKSKVDNQFRLK